MKLTGLGALGIGYVLGSRAGSERYEQIRQLAGQAARRLEEYGASGVAGVVDRRHGRFRPSRRFVPTAVVTSPTASSSRPGWSRALLGVRLLRVDGVVLMSPARVSSAGSGPGVVGDRCCRRAGPPGGGLAEAARLIAASDALLREARATGLPVTWRA